MVRVLLHYISGLTTSIGRDTNGMTAKDANLRYSKFAITQSLYRGSYPIFVGDLTRRILGPITNNEYDVIALVRYRSGRDFVDYVLHPDMPEYAQHKMAAIEETVVWPIAPVFSVVDIGIPLVLMVVSILYILW